MSKQHIDQKHTGNDEHIDSWFVVYSFRRWLNAVVDVGQKLLAMNSNHTEQGLRSTYEHFFVISLMKSLEWGNEIQSFDQKEQQRAAQALIDEENLNGEAAKRYIKASLKREFASENGTELNGILPKMSPLNPQYLTKKQTVFEKIVAFVDKFKGVGGQL